MKMSSYRGTTRLLAFLLACGIAMAAAGCGRDLEPREETREEQSPAPMEDAVAEAPIPEDTKEPVLEDEFARLLDAGNNLMACIHEIPGADAEEQYNKFVEADAFTQTMRSIYGDILAKCEGEEALSRVEYQTRLLDNACPEKIPGNDETSLANQAILYQLYLQQISSSFQYIAEDAAYLEGTGPALPSVEFFSEVPEIPTPDSVIYGITYDSMKREPGNVQYTYLIGADETDANLNYNIYLLAVGMDPELEVEIMDTYVLVKKAGAMVSAMMSGTDAAKGYFLTVSFQA